MTAPSLLNTQLTLAPSLTPAPTAPADLKLDTSNMPLLGGKITPNAINSARANAKPASGGGVGAVGHATNGLNAAAGLINGIGSLVNALQQGTLMGINHQIRKDSIKGDREIADIEKEGAMDGLKSESAHNSRMAELAGKAMDAEAELKKAKGEMSELDHEMKESKITEKMAATGEDKRMKMYFMDSPSYGSPDQRYS